MSTTVPPPLANDRQKTPKSKLFLKHHAGFIPGPAAKSDVDATQRMSQKRKYDDGIQANAVRPKRQKCKKK